MVAWSNDMLKRGYTSGSDSKGAYYMDKLGFKHRWHEGGGLMGRRTIESGNTNPDIANSGMLGAESNDGTYTQDYLEDYSGVTSNASALQSAAFVTDNQFALEPARPDNSFEQHDRQCICQTGLSPDKFKKYLDLEYDYLFYADRMKKYKETYKTPIDKFLNEFVGLFGNPFDINNCYRKAHILGQMYVETDAFKSLEEYDSRYTADYDPWRGRGCIHLTLKENYQKYGKYKGIMDLEEHPWDVAGKLYLAVDSAGWFWNRGNPAHANLNQYADNRETDVVSRYVTGATDERHRENAKFAVRKRITNLLLRQFNAKNCINMTVHP